MLVIKSPQSSHEDEGIEFKSLKSRVGVPILEIYFARCQD